MFNLKGNMLNYRISSYSFRGNYSFLNLEIQRSHYIRPKVTVHKGAETIQGRKLYEEIRYVSLSFGSLKYLNDFYDGENFLAIEGKKTSYRQIYKMEK